MIIAHLSRACYPFHPFGGVEQHVYQFTRTLAQQGHTVHLFTQSPDPGLPPPDFSWPEGVQHHYLPYQWFKGLRRNSIPDRLVNYPVYSLRLGNALPKLNPLPEVVYAQGLAAFGYAAQMLPGVPLVLNPQGMEEFKNRSRAKQLAYTPFRAMVRYAAKRSAAVIATDTPQIPEVERYLKVSPEKIYMVPNSVDLATIDRKLDGAGLPTFVGNAKPSLLILSVGRLEENKGFEFGLEAFKLLETQYPGTLPPDWKWVVAGEGGQRKRLEVQIERLRLTAHVLFPGSLTDKELYGLYHNAGLFLHPTLYEGSSLVTLEAMGSCLPVVASAAGGLPDKVIETGPDESGRLVQPGNAAELACKIKEIVDLSPAERHRLGCNGRALAERKFSLDTSVKNLAVLFRDLHKKQGLK